MLKNLLNKAGPTFPVNGPVDGKRDPADEVRGRNLEGCWVYRVPSCLWPLPHVHFQTRLDGESSPAVLDTLSARRCGQRDRSLQEVGRLTFRSNGTGSCTKV